MTDETQMPETIYACTVERPWGNDLKTWGDISDFVSTQQLTKYLRADVVKKREHDALFAMKQAAAELKSFHEVYGDVANAKDHSLGLRMCLEVLEKMEGQS